MLLGKKWSKVDQTNKNEEKNQYIGQEVMTE